LKALSLERNVAGASMAATDSKRRSRIASEEKFVHALPFLAIGRVGRPAAPALTLATYDCADSEDQRQRVRDIFKKLLTAAQKKLTPGQKTRLQWNEGSVCCMRDNGGTLLYCVVTASMDYPERYAYQLLSDLNQHVLQMPEAYEPNLLENCLHAVLQTPMSELVEKYENHHSPALEAAMSKVIVTKQRMQSGINQMAANREEVSALSDSSASLSQQSFQLQTASQDLYNRYWYQNTKILAVLACLVIVIILLVIGKWHHGKTTS